MSEKSAPSYQEQWMIGSNFNHHDGDDNDDDHDDDYHHHDYDVHLFFHRVL